VNGRLLPPDQAAVSVLDPGFMHGEGLFETMRVYGGRVFRLEQHLARMTAAAAEMGLQQQAERLRPQDVSEALSASGLAEASVRVTVTPSTLVVLVRRLSLPPRERYERGCAVVTVPVALVRGHVLRQMKSLSYLDKLLAQRAAERAGAHEAILVDADGGIVEGAMRNLFAVTEGQLVTPPLDRGLLPGITREAVLEVAVRQQLPAAQRDIALAELMKADECFLTSSLAELLPVASVDGNPLNRPAPGTTTRQLMEGYRRLVVEELGLGGDAKRAG
jgi:branched-chain amino acid aminotransferase